MTAIAGFFGCQQCNKLHALSGITATSTCSCGASLWPQAWAVARQAVAANSKDAAA